MKILKMRLTYQFGVLIMQICYGMFVYHLHIMYDIFMRFDIIIMYIRACIEMNTRAQTHTRSANVFVLCIYGCLPVF